ncbi:MAG: 16S rRNA-methyltransferase [Candidatus Tokpelaia sp. JSC161]|nr:MAG: 16S rRNA-methyltransferase [Candidatus Tokpelaia sp. JSC161]
MLNQVVSSLGDLRGALVLDGTFGAGGYSRTFLRRGAHVIAIDRDPDAVMSAYTLLEKFQDRFQFIEIPFSRLDTVSSEKVDAVVLDVGVSSMQIGLARRGFSFIKDGPLDMRMSQKGLTAGDVVNCMKRNDLIRIFTLLGEERYAKPIAKMIEVRRRKKPFISTLDLAQSVEGLIQRTQGSIHPATRVFQALRIYVNDELGELIYALVAAEKILRPSGRLAVVTFHSLEDRIVKLFFSNRSGRISPSRYLPDIRTKASFIPLFQGVQMADREEILSNVRARSAKLRVGIRTEAPALERDLSLFRVLSFLPCKKGGRPIVSDH